MQTSSSVQQQLINQIQIAEQLNQSIKSLQKIIPIDINSLLFKQTLREYGQQHLILYKQPINMKQTSGQYKYICFTKAQRLQQDKYISQIDNQIYEVDQLRGIIVRNQQLQENKLDENKHELIKCLSVKLQSYLRKFYSQPYGLTCHFNIQDDNITYIVIGICSKNSKINNYYSGEWTSFWNIQQQRVEGVFNIRNHYFENGSMTFHRSQPFVKNLQNDQIFNLKNFSVEQIDRIVAYIEKEQFVFQRELQRKFDDCTSKALKKIRRINPITQSRMIWNVNSVILSRDLKQQQKDYSERE